MTAPVYLSSSIASTTSVLLRIQYDQGLQVSSGLPGGGWVVQVNGVVAPVTSGAFVTTSVANDTIQLTLTNPVHTGDVVLVAYTPGFLQNAALEAAPALSNQTVANGSLNPQLLGAVVNQGSGGATLLTLNWNRAVTGSSATLGFTVLVNGISRGVTSGVFGATGFQQVLTLTSAIQAADLVTIAYSSSTGVLTSGGIPVVSFTAQPVTNASTLGGYSVTSASYVVQPPVTITNSQVSASIQLDLGIVDQGVVGRQGPLLVDFGGTFGVSGQNPSGFLLLQDLRPLADQMTVTVTFYQAGGNANAAFAGSDWQSQIRARIASAMAAARTLDTSYTLAGQVVTAV